MSIEDPIIRDWLIGLRQGSRQQHAAYTALGAWALSRMRPQLLRRYRGWFAAHPDSMEDVVYVTLSKLVRHFRKPTVEIPEKAAAYCFGVLFRVFADMSAELRRDALGYVVANPAGSETSDEWLAMAAAASSEHTELEVLEGLEQAIATLGQEKFDVLMKHDHGLWVESQGRQAPEFGRWTGASGSRRLESWDIEDVVNWRRARNHMSGQVKDATKSARSWLSDVRRDFKRLLGFQEEP